MKTLNLMAALAFTTALPACADTLLNPLFQDHAVLQRGAPVRVWGTAVPNATVTVSIAGQSAETRAAGDGHWQASLPAMQPGGPYLLAVKTDGGAMQTVNDVLVGDVFLCSGQSNMAMSVRETVDAGAEIAISANDSIRMMTIANRTSMTPLGVVPAEVKWEPAKPAAVATWSATCYYFARALQKTAKVPLGLINASWGGANITSFMSAEALRQAGGNDARLDALAAYAGDAAQGQARWGQVVEAYWRGRGADFWTRRTDDWPLAPQGLGYWTDWNVPELLAYTGHMWFRTEVALTAEQATQQAQLSLGTINEEDQTWVNGHFIAGTFGYAQPRTYTLAAGALHAGSNDILVNVFCGWRGCGMFGSPEARRLLFKDGSTVPLSGPWRYKAAAGAESPRVPWGATAGLGMAYNAMIAPLAPYNFKGVLWYQGESNTGDARAYRGLLKAWMADWRRLFEAPLPFLIVQLPDYGLPPVAPESKSDWAQLRESQRLAVNDDRNAALAVTIDIGDHMGLHPGNKQEVGRRLSVDARKLIYGEAITTGPVPVGATRSKGQIAVRFAGFDGRLVAVNNPEPIGFELCDSATCRFAGAAIHGDSVALALPKGFSASHVRYCWGNGPVCTFYDAARMPAVPFDIPVEGTSAARGNKHRQ